MAKPLVVMFARAPHYGAVKTRLARDVGAGDALRFYRSQIARLVSQVGRDARWDTFLCVTPDIAARARGLWPAAVPLAAQGRGDLGRRMIAALRGAGARPAVVIGSDIPQITPRHLAAAFHALGSSSIVFGPARDGGYWLVGARHPGRLLLGGLDGVRWSSPHALADSITRLGGVVLDIVLDDVDDGAAYQTIARSASTRRSTSRSS